MTRPTEVLVELRDTDINSALELLGLVAPRPVVVVIGGAGGLDREIEEGGALARRLRTLLDQGLVPAVEAASAVVVTGGTDSGVMKLVGELTRERSVTLVGVAPRSQVRHADEVLAEEWRARLNPDHHRFLLTRGDDWGSESDVLFALAERVTGGRSTGVVLLANGGGVATYECRRFLDAGWPVITLAGTGRAADDLARHLDRPSRLARITETLGRESRPNRAWGPVRDLDAEVHELQDSAALLRRRLTWRLSAEKSLRAAWSTYDTYDRAASAGKRLDRQLRLTTAGAALLLASSALLLGLDDAYGHLRWLVVMLPVALVLLTALQDSVLPARGHVALRQASEAALSAIWLYVAARQRDVVVEVGSQERPSREGDPVRPPAEAKQRLARTLDTIQQAVLLSGASVRGPVGRGRPGCLREVQDEFAALSARAYLQLRVDAQILYFSRAVSLLHRRRVLAMVLTVALAAIATAFATQGASQMEPGLALLVPLLVLAASTITVLQQRARWHDKIAGASAAVVELKRIGTAASGDEQGQELVELVQQTEFALERERTGWLQSMGQSAIEAGRFHGAPIRREGS